MRDKDTAQLAQELEQARQRIAALEAEGQQGAETLSQCRAELKTSYEELDNFAHALSHDLRGSLGLIISFAQVLKEYHATLPEEELSRYLDTIAQKGHRVIGVIDGLLEEPTEPPPDDEITVGPMDTAQVVTKALEILHYLVEEHRAKIILPENWPVALGYAPWVEEVWFNYLSNAIKYGGRPPRVELGADVVDQTVRFWVRDNGAGLTPEEQAEMFTPSARVDPGRSTGYGLGLVIVRRIVERLGGAVGVESAGVPGQGCEFFFTLPLARG
jgi:two-component system, sensor histidine kinase and response regulator